MQNIKNSTIYLTYSFDNSSYDFELTCFTKYIGSYIKHVDAMNTDINYNIEFYLYKDNTYKSISTYSAMGSTEVYEENGYIYLESQSIKPRGSMDSYPIIINYEDNVISSLEVSLKTSTRASERYIIELNKKL